MSELKLRPPKNHCRVFAAIQIFSYLAVIKTAYRVTSLPVVTPKRDSSTACPNVPQERDEKKNRSVTSLRMTS